MKNFYFILITALLAACGNGKTDQKYECKSLNEHFRHETEMNDSSVTLSSIINIEDWVVNDSVLLCRSDDADNIFYSFDLNTFETIDSFGTIGQGPDEYIIPRIVKSNHGRIILADIARNKFMADYGRSSFPLSEHCYNSPFDIRYPIIGFTELRGKDRVLYVSNIETAEVVDSIVVTMADGLSIGTPSDYKAASNGEYLVMVRQFCDEIKIIRLNECGKFDRVTCYMGAGNCSKIKPYYVDVACGKDRFYVISMKNVTFNGNGDPEDKCRILVYDYEAEPLVAIDLTFFPRKILSDEKNERLLILSATDDDIHILPVPLP